MRNMIKKSNLILGADNIYGIPPVGEGVVFFIPIYNVL